MGKYDDGKMVERLKDYFEQKLIDETHARVKLLQGAAIRVAEDVLSSDEIAELRDKKELTILPKTKKHFKVEDDIVLNLKAKNIASMQVKVYELNLEKICLLEHRRIDPQMSTSYLHPTR